MLLLPIVLNYRPSIGVAAPMDCLLWAWPTAAWEVAIRTSTATIHNTYTANVRRLGGGGRDGGGLVIGHVRK